MIPTDSVSRDPAIIEVPGTTTKETQESSLSNSASTNEYPAGWVKQLLWYRQVRQPWMLTKLLKQKYGKGNHQVEMRHNAYEIWAPSMLTSDEIQRLSGIRERLSRTKSDKSGVNSL